MMCRVIVTDGTAAWVGSDSGNVKRIELQTKQVTGGNTRCWLEHTHTLRHVAKSRRSSTVFGSTASADLDDLSRADSARASEMAASEEPAAGPVASRAHAGPVTAVEVHSCFVFTSGGTQSHPALHQWSPNGMLQHSHKLNQIGMCHLRLRCHSACQSGRQAEGSEPALLVHACTPSSSQQYMLEPFYNVGTILCYGMLHTNHSHSSNQSAGKLAENEVACVSTAALTATHA